MSRVIVFAGLHLLSTDDGGRSEALSSGYRSLLRLEGSDIDFGVELELDPRVSPTGLAPGASGPARLYFWAIAELPSLFAGQRFELREGTRIVGAGIIIESPMSDVARS